MSAIDNLRKSYIIFPRRGCNPCVHCSTCRVNADEVADAIIAELRGTCRAIKSDKHLYLTCSECNWLMGDCDKYCAHCGRKVEVPE